MDNTMTVGISSCPNDTYIFHALLTGLVESPFPVKMHMADVEALNNLALEGALPVTKVSMGVVPQIMDNYAILSSGAALGWGCGPVVVAREPLSGEACKNAVLATPGEHTTANMLLDVTGVFAGPREHMVFNEVMPAVKSGKADAGVVIHEGRFTYEKEGLVKVLDLGQWWEQRYDAPLPLGVIVVRRDVAADVARKMEQSIAASLSYANSHPEASWEFIREHAQELSDPVIAAHIRTFVTEFSLDLRKRGRKTIVRTVEKILKKTGASLPPAGLFVPPAWGMSGSHKYR